jgi:hypothetical protein
VPGKPEEPGRTADLSQGALEGLFDKELTNAFQALGCFNLAVFGATGRASRPW